MLTLIILSALLMQEPPAPPRGEPETRTRVIVMGPDGPNSLDRDGDGVVTREEFSAPMSDHFARLDANGDGRLSGDEMPSGPGQENVFVMRGPGGPGPHRWEIRRPGGEVGPGAERREERFVILDGPGSEPGAPMTWRRERGSHDIEIRRLGEGDGPGEMDKDGDGKVSEAEFTAPLRDAFARMDADRSGFIEEGERGAEGNVHVFTRRVERREADAD